MTLLKELFFNISKILIIAACISLPCHAQSNHEEENISKDRYSLYYYFDRIDIDENYLDNARQIARIKEILAKSTRIDSITIYAYASPEGSYRRNSYLAEKRAEAAREFILKNLPDESVLLPENIHLRPMGENWEGLQYELEENYHLMNRDRVLKIIHANIPDETKKWRLKRLDNGFTWKWIISKHMPALRLATWICVYMPIQEPEKFSFTQKLEIPDSIPTKLNTPLPEKDRHTLLALKTNLLYDALTLLNFSVEYPFNERFSVLYYHQFPWWRWGESNNKYCIRFLSIGAEARWWFKPMPRPRIGDRRKRDKLMGHFLGLYAESGKWDFEFGRSICRQGEHWSAGFSYGYAMPIGKRLNLEFSVSMGYASIPYRKFIPSENYDILYRDPARHGRWNYFGPTKAQISLVMPIMVETKTKGGAK